MPDSIMTQSTDAYFAGRIFARGEQDGYRFFLWGDVPVGQRKDAGISFTSLYSEPADGAFLCQLEPGWLFVTGTRKNSLRRNTFLDDTPDAYANALALQGLGCEVLTVDEGNARVQSDGVPLYSVTGEEKRRATALAKHAKG
ncbi:hypothetical protein [Cupriavidus metallidurans]|uniref:hypothetical protein n=1 Tax=Cupriavidus metallidurans TaxID=119219 RepID=UPI000CE03037|nr:hypothetical protein [Cupriavidus metallidurans]AVA38270.1 hypothetical protein C3Z06_32205 [Cupriavidus metallidurans]